MARAQAFAAFGAAAFQHQLPSFGTHTEAKPMGFRTTAVVRLKCTFHFQSPTVIALLANKPFWKSERLPIQLWTVKLGLPVNNELRQCYKHIRVAVQVL